MVNLLTREMMEAELGRAFAPEQTASLVGVLDSIRQMEVERAADTRELKRGLAALTGEVRQLAVAQQRTEERVEELTAAQTRTEERLERLETAVERLAEAQARTEERVGRVEAALERLAEAQARTEEQVQELVAAMKSTNARVDDLKGWQLELRYKERAGAYFGPLLRRLRVFSPHELEDELEPHLSPAEFADLLQLDLLLSGQPRRQPEVPLVWLAVEVSAVVDRNDVERAQRRAAVLRRVGYRAIPSVAGEQITAGAQEEVARAGNVLVIQDGRSQFWEDALTAALAD